MSYQLWKIMLIALLFLLALLAAFIFLRKPVYDPKAELSFGPEVPGHMKAITHDLIQQYPQLQGTWIKIRRQHLKSSTMRAFPGIVYQWPFHWRQVYYIDVAIHVRDREDLMVNDLPYEVLKGWIAHELGHLADYRERSLLGMMIYGLRYALSSSFLQSVEHRADELAVQAGYYAEVKATKEFIERELFNEKNAYSSKLRKRYMSIEELDICNRNWLERKIKFKAGKKGI
ncbi:MAG TPA: hypothetical protein VJ917_05030 [Saprospiraceae bacterium]|nr:hypothetical protein [Saprospiraceae bacterium]